LALTSYDTPKNMQVQRALAKLSEMRYSKA